MKKLLEFILKEAKQQQFNFGAIKFSAHVILQKQDQVMRDIIKNALEKLKLSHHIF